MTEEEFVKEVAPKEEELITPLSLVEAGVDPSVALLVVSPKLSKLETEVGRGPVKVASDKIASEPTDKGGGSWLAKVTS